MPLARIPGTSQLVHVPDALGSSHATGPTQPSAEPPPQVQRRYVVSLDQTLPVPYAAQIVARIREAFTSIPGFVFGWNARSPQSAVSYVLLRKQGELLGANGCVFVDAIMQLAEEDKLSVLVNVGLHELGHRLGLRQTHDPANIMFDVASVRQLAGRKTFNAGQIVRLRELVASRSS